MLNQAIEKDDLLTDESPPGLRVVRITSDTAYASSHIYMEAPVFTPDSKRFIFQRTPVDCLDANGGYTSCPRREYWLCDLDDNFALRQLTDEPNALAPSVSPDGKYLYCFLNEPDPSRGSGIVLRRVCLRSFTRETVQVLDKPLSGHAAPPSRIYVLSSIRSDGQAVCTGVFLGDGRTAPPLWGVLVCHIKKGSAEIVLAGPNYFNPHPQYARSADPARLRDILVQQNLGADTDARGNLSHSRPGCTLHVVRDDGHDLRVLPCGDAVERCHGHEAWRGAMPSVIVGVDHLDSKGNPSSRPLVEATPIPLPSTSAQAIAAPRGLLGARDHHREIPIVGAEPMFGHTAFDPAGTLFVGDWYMPGTPAEDTRLYVGTLADEPDAALHVRYLLHPRSGYGPDQWTHPHPFLSPDGRRAFFNSAHGGIPQIWMVEDFSYP